MVAGPNGSGKTALFDAIRIFKEALAGYSRRTPGQSQVHQILSQVGPVVTIGADQTRISASIQITRMEAEVIELPEEHPLFLDATVSVSAVPSGQSERVTSISGVDVQYLQNLFGVKYGDESLLGVVDHIGADRRFASNQVASINFSDEYAETELQRLVANSVDKFQNLTQDLVMMRMLDMDERERQVDTPSNYIESVRDIFRHFLPDREFLGVDMPPAFRGPPRVLVGSGGVTHDINQLSSGQREILMTYTHLEKLRPTGSIILFDEPELHLHAALQRRVISHLQRLLERGNNQIWVITHSEEIVGSTEYDSLFSTTANGDPALVPVSNKAERLELLQSLGASIGLQLTSPKILFLEGDSDADLLQLLFDTLPAGLSLVPTAGKGNLMRLTGTAMELLETVIRDGQFYLVRDRDIEDNPMKLDQLAEKYRHKFFVWNRYHIENYLLDEEAIFSVLCEDDDIPDPTSCEGLGAQLRFEADQQRDTVLARRIESTLNQHLRNRMQLNPQEGVRSSLEKAAQQRLKRTKEYLDPPQIQTLLDETEAELNEHWEENWKGLCIGREVLMAYHRKHVHHYLGYEVFRNRVARKIRTMHRVHEDIIRVMAEVTHGLEQADTAHSKSNSTAVESTSM